MSDSNIKGLGSRALPAPLSPNTYGPVRTSRYGEAAEQPFGQFRPNLADEGTYFLCHNITNDASTTLAGHAAPVLADADATMTKPLIHVMGSQAITSLVRGYLDYIEIEVVTAGANGTQACWAAQLDTGATRYSSGTVETLTTVNPNMQSSATPALVWKAGPFVAGAESASVRNLGFGTHRPSIEIAGDKYLFTFGHNPLVANATAAASVRTFVTNLGPVVLGPTDQLLLALHGQASQNAAGVYKIRGGWWER